MPDSTFGPMASRCLLRCATDSLAGQVGSCSTMCGDFGWEEVGLGGWTHGRTSIRFSSALGWSGMTMSHSCLLEAAMAKRVDAKVR